MVHVNVAASAAAATVSSNAILSRPRRLHSGGSFHAGAPFPQFGSSPYDGPSQPSSSADHRRRRQSSNAPPTQGPIRRISTHNRYHTFPTQPPKTPSENQRGQPIYSPFAPGVSPREQALGRVVRPGRGTGDAFSVNDGDDEDNGLSSPSRSSVSSDPPHVEETPLPWKQLGLLAFLSLAEQTALNSIGPYLPAMVGSFPAIPAGQEGVYVGLLASSFALAQLATNLIWGYLSDRMGRKPVMLLGTALLGLCFVFFGFCADYRQLLAVHVAMGLLNGNAAVVPTCLGEVTDKTNQSRAFTWLPVMYSLGSITGPALGGLLVGVDIAGGKYPFLAPNLVAAAFLGVSVLVLAIWFEETLEKDDLEQEESVTFKERLGRIGNWLGGLFGRGSGSRVQDDHQDDHQDTSPDETRTLLGSASSPGGVDNKDDSALANISKNPAVRQLANRTTLAVLVSYLVFQLSNISFNSLYPIFASAPPPTGRDLGPSTIGLSLSLAGLATILFQGFLYQPLKARLGNLGTYRYSLLGMAISMALMPFVGYLNESKPFLGLGTGAGWLWSELGVILVLKNICAVGGLSSVMLLITNSAPSHETLGTLQGIAQTLSAAGRSVGPFLSGGLFTLSTRVQPKGEALAWGLFAGVTLLGWAGTLLIDGKGQGLESADFEEPISEDEGDEEEGGFSGTVDER
ncbi:MFS general substrate transporter-like protein [Rhypophila decipiens]|uniref:MFS general substrate transporter-like protein n=1 Tax=Rhypophila decipiens TaxID=261697 RepID=A0AAN6Y6W6_9PEZI|nr:MFS general substrate transporter-like protein [Rhypophila decipiens]